MKLKLLLFLSVIAVGTTAIANPSQVVLKNFFNSDGLRREVHRLATLGWKIYTGEFNYSGDASAKYIHGRELVLFKDLSSPVYRHAVKTITVYERDVASHMMVSEGMLRSGKVAVDRQMFSAQGDDRAWDERHVTSGRRAAGGRRAASGRRVEVEGTYSRRPIPGDRWEHEGLMGYVLEMSETEDGEIPVAIHTDLRTTDLHRADE